MTADATYSIGEATDAHADSYIRMTYLLSEACFFTAEAPLKELKKLEKS